MGRPLATVLLLLLVVAGVRDGAQAEPPRRGTVSPGLPSSRLPAMEPALPELARQLLRRRMERHGKDGFLLYTAVVLLQRDVVRELASSIEREPRLVRPREGAEDELNTLLPERFFVFQDALRDRAHALAVTAEQGDPQAVTRSFAQVTELCVACHEAYLDPRGR